MAQEFMKIKKSLAEASKNIEILIERVINLQFENCAYKNALMQIKEETAERNIGEMATNALETYRTWNDPV